MGFPFKRRLPLSRRSTVLLVAADLRPDNEICRQNSSWSSWRWWPDPSPQTMCFFFLPLARCTLWVHRHQKKGGCERCEPKCILIQAVRRSMTGAIGIRPEDLEAYVELGMSWCNIADVSVQVRRCCKESNVTGELANAMGFAAVALM